ncbi:carbonic anhydrase, partial [Streptomyces chattanoogensis]
MPHPSRLARSRHPAHGTTYQEETSVWSEDREAYGRFAAGQSPLALFITCSDSRVVPSLITGAGPGELFELRTAGNAVPVYQEGMAASSEAATIEYAM